MRLSRLAIAILGDALLLGPVLVEAAEALWLQPSSKWLGIDGSWSTFEVHVGAPAQAVYLTPSTALSEIWVVGKGGCYSHALCTTARGGVLDYRASRSWTSLGAWSLGLGTWGLGGNGDYGLETVAMYSSLGGGKTTAVDGALVAAINSTDYYQGYLGLGVVQGRFGNKIANPLISQLAETYGIVGSHSYGYTAGASHMADGVPASLVLGGVDKLRFEDHDTVFTLDPKTRVPQVRLRGLSVTAADPSMVPATWGIRGTSKPLVSMNDSVVAVIDSSLPYLSLPPAICERFASALNLEYNDTLGVYTFTSSERFLAFRQKRPYSFTFSLSSWDNTDSFGPPLDAHGVVNITVSSAAFALLLQYPFKSAFEPTDSSVPYFPLRRANNTNEFAIGRVFMQEAYMITKYDEEIFSLHQARFPDAAATNYSVVTIPRSPNSQYPVYTGATRESGPGLTTGQTAGVVVAAFLITGVSGLTLWYCRRRRRRRRLAAKSAAAVADHVVDDEPANKKDLESTTTETEPPPSPAVRIFSFISRRKRSRRPSSSHEMHSTAAEVGADVSHERFELEVPPGPAELDGSNEVLAVSAHGTGHSNGAAARGSSPGPYEMARIRLLQQLQEQLPTYSPPAAVTAAHVDGGSGRAVAATATAGEDDEGKSEQDVSPVAHFRPASPGPLSAPVVPTQDPSPVSAPSSDGENYNSNSLPYNGLPSPMTPHPDWGTRIWDLPSPMTVVAPPLPSPQSACAPSAAGQSSGGVSDLSRSNSCYSHDAAPPHAVGLASTSQRTPIDPTRIICLGPLPENVQLPLPRGFPGGSSTSSGQSRVPAPAQPAPGAATRAGVGAVAGAPPGVSKVLPPPAAAALVPAPLQIRLPQQPQMLTVPGAANTGQGLRRGSNDTLGSNFTVEEEARMHEMTRQQSTPSGDSPRTPRSPYSLERIDIASELVHVPQIPEKRYSWEEDKR